jgi:hypothetical protein
MRQNTCVDLHHLREGRPGRASMHSISFDPRSAFSTRKRKAARPSDLAETQRTFLTRGFLVHRRSWIGRNDSGPDDVGWVGALRLCAFAWVGREGGSAFSWVSGVSRRPWRLGGSTPGRLALLRLLEPMKESRIMQEPQLIADCHEARATEHVELPAMRTA